MAVLDKQELRQLGKQALLWSRVKIVYTRVTLTRFTTIYFFFALVNCIVLVSLQAASFSNNAKAASVTSAIITKANLTRTFPIVDNNGQLRICDSIPGQAGTICFIADFETDEERHFAVEEPKPPRMDNYGGFGNHSHEDKMRERRTLNVNPVFDNESGRLEGVSIDQGPQGVISVDLDCIQSLTWLNDIFVDDKREDLVILAFHIWLFALSFVTILNESMPHLGAALASQVMATCWAAFRLAYTHKLRQRYNDLVVSDSCSNFDLLGEWWDCRLAHAIPVLVVNAIVLVGVGFISTKLFRIYVNQSYSRVGASQSVSNAYKLVLLLSVLLQLASFFTLASTAIWIDKVVNGSIRFVARHIALYLAAFIVMAILEIPWVVLGWVSVRRENKKMYIVYMIISVILVGLATMMFTSPLYRFIFDTWSFFATLTVTSYLLLVFTSLLGLMCRVFGFGKGLAHFLSVQDVLEHADFTPVYFTKNPDNVDLSSIAEKAPSRFSVRTEEMPVVTPINNLGLQPPLKALVVVDKKRASSHTHVSFASTVISSYKGWINDDVSDAPQQRLPTYTVRSKSSNAHETASTHSSTRNVPNLPPLSPMSSIGTLGKRKSAASSKSSRLSKSTTGTRSEQGGRGIDAGNIPLPPIPVRQIIGLPRNPRPSTSSSSQGEDGQRSMLSRSSASTRSANYF